MFNVLNKMLFIHGMDKLSKFTRKDRAIYECIRRYKDGTNDGLWLIQRLGELGASIEYDRSIWRSLEYGKMFRIRVNRVCEIYLQY